jgi:hypothetical protein
LSIAERLDIPFPEIFPIAENLHQAGLLDLLEE